MITVGIPLHEHVNFGFYQRLQDAIRVDEETEMRTVTGAPTPVARNKLVKMAQESRASHIFFIDSDNVLPAGTLDQLLSYDLDIVGAWYVRKLRPFTPVVLEEVDTKGDKRPYHPIWPERKLQKVDGLGCGAMLIKMEVFNKVERPYFDYRFTDDPIFYTSEDIYFCQKAIEAGYDVWCDGTLMLGHITHGVLYPTPDNKVRFETGNWR